MSDLANRTRACAEAVSAYAHPRAIFRSDTAIKRAREALAARYPTVVHILGCDPFFEFAADFIAGTPREAPLPANDTGRFPEWVEQQKIGHILPYLPAIAQIDRLHSESQHSAADRPLSRAVIAGLSAAQWSASKAKLHAATRFGWFAVPAPSIWLAHFDLGALNPTIEWCAEGILITRPTEKVLARRIGPAEHRILAGLRVGETIGSATAAAHALYPQANITDAVEAIIQSGAVASLRPGRSAG